VPWRGTAGRIDRQTVRVNAPATPPVDDAPVRLPAGRRWLRRLLLWGVVAAFVGLLVRLLSGITWSDVGDAIAKLAIWQILVLLVVVGFRAVLTAVPLRLLVPELGLVRALINDLSANLVATVSPAPSDLVLRIAMFRGWGIDPARGVTGLVLQSLLFYVARLWAPVLGFFLLLAALDTVDPVYAWAALTSGLLALGLMGALWIASRSQASARWLGALGARIVRRVRRRSAQVDDWPDRAAAFQVEAGGLLRKSAPIIGIDYAVLLLVEGLLLLLALRFVGVDPATAGAVLIVASFLCVYPLTGLPLLGLGVLDAALVALIASGSSADPDLLVAGVIVWRVAFQLVPLSLGAITLTQWRRAHPDRDGDDPPVGEE
jgi:hypothetical protein